MNNLTAQRRRAKLPVVLVLTLVVAACGGRPEKSVATTPAPVIQASPTTAPAPIQTRPAPIQTKPEPVKPAPVVRQTKEPVTAAVAPAVTVKPEPKPAPPPPPATGDFLGLVPDGVTGLLGQPRLVRREKPAEVWQYASDTCVLHVFLYGDDAGNGLHVDHLEATDLQGARASTDQCLAVLVQR